MEIKDIVVGNFYRAKKPIKLNDGGYNDRRVLWISEDKQKIQYDSPVIRQGSHYPIIQMEKFLKWTGKEITKDEYMLEEKV